MARRHCVLLDGHKLEHGGILLQMVQTQCEDASHQEAKAVQFYIWKWRPQVAQLRVLPIGQILDRSPGISLAAMEIFGVIALNVNQQLIHV